MKKKYYIGIMLTIAILSGAILYVASGWNDTTGYRPFYGGKLALTAEEYADFKYAVADNEVEIQDIIVLSSPEPYVVQFEVSVPQDYAWEYGDITYTTQDHKIENRFWNIALATLIGGVLLVIVWAFIDIDSEKYD